MFPPASLVYVGRPIPPTLFETDLGSTFLAFFPPCLSYPFAFNPTSTGIFDSAGQRYFFFARTGLKRLPSRGFPVPMDDFPHPTVTAYRPFLFSSVCFCVFSHQLSRFASSYALTSLFVPFGSPPFQFFTAFRLDSRGPIFRCRLLFLCQTHNCYPGRVFSAQSVTPPFFQTFPDSSH